MNSSISHILKSEKIPYLLSVLFLIAGWSLTNIGERLVRIPIIEYSICEEETAGKHILVLDLENISEDKLISGVLFKLQFLTGDQKFMENVVLEAHSPMAQSACSQVGQAIGKDFANFTVKELQPAWKLTARVPISSQVLPELQYSTQLNNGVTERALIVLKEKSLDTFLISHQPQLIITVALVSFLLIILYIGAQLRMRKS